MAQEQRNAYKHPNETEILRADKLGSQSVSLYIWENVCVY